VSEYVAPESVEEAVRLLDDGSRILGGGTWLVPELGRGGAWPRRVVDLRLAGLAEIQPRGDGLRIGATATYSDLLESEAVAERARLLRLVAAHVTGGWTIRNQGTVGGSVAAARPQSDLPAALVALGAVAVVAGPDGERSAPVEELVLGQREILTALDLAATPAAAGYAKLKRGASSWPIATAAALVFPDGSSRLVLGAVAPRPLVVDPADVSPAVTEPLDDALAPGWYRAAVAPAIARRALEQALENAPWN
jgi:CO/xanthine dehydrogenase FAD-binding subunit